MAPRNLKSQAVMKLMEDGGVRTLSELLDLGVSKHTVGRLVEAGWLIRPAEGIYQAAGVEPDPLEQYAVIAKRLPDAVMILYTAAVIHGITQVMPGDIWIGLPPHHRHAPRMGDGFGGVELRPLRWSRTADVEIGVEERAVRGTSVRVTNPARTVVDMWRYSTLNRSLPEHHARVDEESFLNCIGTYLSPAIGGSIAEVSRMARDIGVSDGMMPHIKDFAHISTMAR